MVRRFALSALLAALGSLVLVSGAAAAEQLLGTWGSYAKDPLPGRFYELKDLDTDPRGYVYVLDEQLSGAGRIQKFTPSGKLVRQFGIPADEDDRWDTDEITGALHEPNSLAVGPDRNIYVAEGGERTRISVWSPLGKYLRSFSSGGPGPGQISDPGGMLFDGSGQLGVADTGNDRLAIFTSAGGWVSEIPVSLGYTGPTDVAGMGSTLFVAAGSLIAKVPQSGQVSIFGEEGPNGEAPPFERADGIATGNGVLYVADSRLSRVIALSPDGAYLRSLGLGPGSQPGQMVEPNAVATDCRGNIFVADLGNARIQRFGNPGAGTCGNPAKDKQERLVVKIRGKRNQRFRQAFAVQVKVHCDRPCRGVLKGTIKIKGRRKPIRLVSEPFSREFPGPAKTNVAPTERGTDLVVAALERRKKVVAKIQMTARDLTGRKLRRKKNYRLR